MTLFLGTIEFEFAVEAEDLAAAERIVRRDWHRIRAEFDVEVSADDVLLCPTKRMPDGWDADSVPYGSTRTIDELLAKKTP